MKFSPNQRVHQPEHPATPHSLGKLKVNKRSSTTHDNNDESLIACRPEHGRWQEAATNECLGLARIFNICFYSDSHNFATEQRNFREIHCPPNVGWWD